MHSIGFPTTMIFSHETIIKTCCYFGRGGGGGRACKSCSRLVVLHLHMSILMGFPTFTFIIHYFIYKFSAERHSHEDLHHTW